MAREALPQEGAVVNPFDKLFRRQEQAERAQSSTEIEELAQAVNEAAQATRSSRRAILKEIQHRPDLAQALLRARDQVQEERR